MITQLSQLFAGLGTLVKPSDFFLQKGSWVLFSNEFPSTHDWCKGRLFEVAEEPLIVPYQLSYILPASDYKDVDLSNSTAGAKLYPEEYGMLYQMAIGFKPGDYVVHTYVPRDKYVYALGDSSMFPDVSDAAKKYLGAKTWRDSPWDAPLIQFYAIKDLQAFYLRFYVLEGVAFEKCSTIFQINKCKLVEILEPTDEQFERAKKIMYYTEFPDA